MHGRKKKPVITATWCNEMENLRLAIEVLERTAARFIHIDFNTGRGSVRVRGEEKFFSFYFVDEKLLHFAFTDDPRLCRESLGRWYTARFNTPGEAWVIEVHASCAIRDGQPREHGIFSLWHVGRSADGQVLQPLYWHDYLELTKLS